MFQLRARRWDAWAAASAWPKDGRQCHCSTWGASQHVCDTAALCGSRGSLRSLPFTALREERLQCRVRREFSVRGFFVGVV